MTLPPPRQTDEELIAEFQRGSEAPFRQLVGRYKDPLTNFVYRFIGDVDECDDVVQETFIRVYRNKLSYRPVAKFSTWIYTIATNLAKSHMHRRKLRRFVTFGRSAGESDSTADIPDEHAQTDRLVETGILEERIQKALDALPEKYREIIILREIQELSYEEIAGITGIGLGTVKSRMNRGRAKLQEMLKDLREN